MVGARDADRRRIAVIVMIPVTKLPCIDLFPLVIAGRLSPSFEYIPF
jgi:hypothetical protein